VTIALRFERYGFRYSIGDRPAIENLSLEVPPGKVVSVISPQGKGKTTLLRAAAGLLGEIYQGDVTGSVGDTGDCAAFFDGYVQVTLAVETVREEIGLPLLALGLNRAERDRRAAEVCAELKIEHLYDRRVTDLSGGEEKLVGIAAALLPDAAVHVFDEPFEQLDVAHVAALIRALKHRARLGRLVLVATSSPDTAINIADAAIVWDNGWKYIDRPTYAEADGESAVARFVGDSARLAGVRRFRDAARLAR
jgi:energy-coupling factor transporter ATP-binding protein EcfA2